MPRFGDTSQKTNSQKKYFFIDGNIWTSYKFEESFFRGGERQTGEKSFIHSTPKGKGISRCLVLLQKYKI